MSRLTLKTEGETHVIVTRHFAAPPEAVYRAHTEPELIQKWLLGPEGWTMPVCINEARPGGRFRYEWSNGKGGHFYITGELVELEPNRKIVHIERMHLPDPTPDNHIETRFDADGGGTLIKMAQKGYRVGVLDLTRGEMGTRGTPEIRRRALSRIRWSPWTA